MSFLDPALHAKHKKKPEKKTFYQRLESFISTQGENKFWCFVSFSISSLREFWFVFFCWGVFESLSFSTICLQNCRQLWVRPMSPVNQIENYEFFIFNWPHSWTYPFFHLWGFKWKIMLTPDDASELAFSPSSSQTIKFSLASENVLWIYLCKHLMELLRK